MGFRNNTYATVWKVEPGKGKYTNVRLSVSRKNAEGNYEQDFAGFCMFIGTARAKAEKLRERERIKLTSVDVSNRWDAVNNREYVTYKVFDFEPADGGSGSSPVLQNHRQVDEPIESGDEENLPF